MEKETYKVIGLMSGTSLDGLDIAFCHFHYDENWRWEIMQAKTIAYPAQLYDRLKVSMELSGRDLALLDKDLGIWMGESVSEFIQKYTIETVDFIASHGHTVFHQVDRQLTLQIGNPNFIHAISKTPVISDFRTLDVANGGQGAPLVPVGDQLLFKDVDFCLNLGGIANISFKARQGDYLAYDISVCNILLNYITHHIGKPYDEDGELASRGKIITSLLDEWNALPYLKKPSPKSLGREDIDKDILAAINFEEHTTEDLLATSVAHISTQISAAFSKHRKDGRILMTGGGALNKYLIQEIKKKTASDFEFKEADLKVIHFKESLIFAFLGVLNVRYEYNCLSSVTGAQANSVSGQKLGDI